MFVNVAITRFVLNTCLSNVLFPPSCATILPSSHSWHDNSKTVDSKSYFATHNTSAHSKLAMKRDVLSCSVNYVDDHVMLKLKFKEVSSVVKLTTIHAEGLGFDSRAGQNGQSVANGSPPLRLVFGAVL